MLFIFDWDGTLADSRDHIVCALQETIQQLGFPHRTEQQCAAMIGLGLHETVATLFPGSTMSDTELFRQSYSERFLALGESDFPLTLFDGVVETLDTLKSQGHRLAIATGKSRRGLNRVLSSLDLSSLFDVTRAADETASKPDPLMLQEILMAVDESASNAVMIGDTSYDLEMAKNIGMDRIAVSYGVHDRHVLHDFHPVLMLDCIGEILDWTRIRV